MFTAKAQRREGTQGAHGLEQGCSSYLGCTPAVAAADAEKDKGDLVVCVIRGTALPSVGKLRL